MIRARAGHGPLRPAPILFVVIAGLAIVAGCVSGSPTDGPSREPGASATGGAPTDSGDPSAGLASPTPFVDLPTPTPDPATGSPGPNHIACSGNDQNREFFKDAAAVMAWPVYCAVLDDGWYLEDGRYELADGGYLEVTYRGPGDAHVAIVQGTVCAGGTDVETCAPRDALIGPAEFGDREAELGRLANGLVLDVDRGATPSWRATGLGLTEDAFRMLGADLVLVDG